jgi:hypothetical protein
VPFFYCQQIAPPLQEYPLKNPDHDARRTVIREWMALPKDKRQSEAQALSFAAGAAERHSVKGPGDSSARVIGWLLPRVGRN